MRRIVPQEEDHGSPHYEYEALISLVEAHHYLWDQADSNHSNLSLNQHYGGKYSENWSLLICIKGHEEKYKLVLVK